MSRPAPPLPGVLHSLAPLLNHYGYLAVFGLVFLEDFGVPAPGETVLIAAAVYAGAHQLNIYAVVGLALTAAVLGDNVGFAIGHFGGRPLVLRLGRYVRLTEARLDRAEAFFTRHGGKIVAIARFIEGLRQVNGIVAGVIRMPWRRFLVFNAIGAALWVGLWSAVGYFAGRHITPIYREVNRLSLYFAAVVVLAVIVVVGRRLLRRRRERKGSAS